MAKYHISPDGVARRCNAGKGENARGCRYHIPDEQHYTTKEDALKGAEQQLSKENGGSFGSKPVRNPKKAVPVRDDVGLTQKEKMLKDVVYRMSSNIVETRASLGNLSVEQGVGDPQRAEECLQNAISFASKRGDENLMSKLSSAKTLPTSIIKTNDGRKFSSDELLVKDKMYKHVEEGRKELVSAAMKIAENADDGKYSFENDSGKYTMTVSSDGFNQDTFNNLPKNVREKLTQEKNSINIDLARTHLTDEEFANIVTESQTINYVNGRPKDFGGSNVVADTKFNGNNDTEKIQSAVQNIGNFYEDAHMQFGGTTKELKADRDQQSTTFKQAATNFAGKQNTYIPGRSRHNGLIVSGRQTVNLKKAKEHLSPEKLALITKKTVEPASEAQLKKLLSDEDKAKIFNAKKVSLRVVEK